VTNRRQAYAYASKIGFKAFERLILEAIRELKRKQQRLNPAFRADEGAYTPAAIRASILQLQEVLDALRPQFERGIIDAKRAAQAMGRKDTYKTLAILDERFAGIVSTGRLDVAMQLDPRVKKREATVLRRLAAEFPNTSVSKGIVDRYGQAVIEKFEGRMRAGMAAGKRWSELSRDLTSESSWLQSTPKHWADRIVRTEAMGAYNRSALDAGVEAESILGDQFSKILIATFDNRTGWDSYQVHGQIRRMNEPFEWVTRKGETISYLTPPNRPNDREVVVFHRIGSPLPDAMKPVSDGEYRSRYYAQNKSGSPPPRPEMSTIPLSQFKG
jgi:hypothetical protein